MVVCFLKKNSLIIGKINTNTRVVFETRGRYNGAVPNIQSAIKKVRKDKRRAAVNLRLKKRYKQAVKAARQDPSAETLQLAQKELDKAAKGGVIKKGKSSRLKSRLAKTANARRK